MGSDVGQIFPTASLLWDHSILYVLVCEKRFSIPGQNLRYSSFIYPYICLICRDAVSIFLRPWKEEVVPIYHIPLF